MLASCGGEENAHDFEAAALHGPKSSRSSDNIMFENKILGYCGRWPAARTLRARQVLQQTTHRHISGVTRGKKQGQHLWHAAK
jgi:hypothetical protein